MEDRPQRKQKRKTTEARGRPDSSRRSKLGGALPRLDGAALTDHRRPHSTAVLASFLFLSPYRSLEEILCAKKTEPHFCSRSLELLGCEVWERGCEDAAKSAEEKPRKTPSELRKSWGSSEEKKSKKDEEKRENKEARRMTFREKEPETKTETAR